MARAGEIQKKQESVSSSNAKARLNEELERIKKRVGIGHEVDVKWCRGAIKFKNGRQLEEEVVGDTIIIYTENPSRANELLAHGFAEWLLNRHTKRYRLIINKLIEIFEQIQYEEKEKIAEALAKLMEESHPTKTQK